MHLERMGGGGELKDYELVKLLPARNFRKRFYSLTQYSVLHTTFLHSCLAFLSDVRSGTCLLHIFVCNKFRISALKLVKV
jgi:hypothetical protein